MDAIKGSAALADAPGKGVPGVLLCGFDIGKIVVGNQRPAQRFAASGGRIFRQTINDLVVFQCF